MAQQFINTDGPRPTNFRHGAKIINENFQELYEKAGTAGSFEGLNALIDSQEDYALGAVVHVGGVPYYNDGISTDIDGLPGWRVLSYAKFGYRASLTGDGVSTSHALPTEPGSIDEVSVFISGLAQTPGDDFTLSGATITFSAPLPDGAPVLISVALPSDATRIDAAALTINTGPFDGETIPDALGEIVSRRRDRDALVTKAAGGWAPALGWVEHVGGVGYRYDGISTAITDLPGWAPVPPFMVEHWGAVGDGTTDDTAAFQRGLDWLVTHGGVLHLQDRKYYIAGTVYLNLSGITSHVDILHVSIEGTGSGSTGIKVGSGSQGIMVVGDTAAGLRSELYVKGIAFSAASYGNGIGMVLRDLLHCHFEDLLFVSLLYGIDTMDFLNCAFIRCRWEGGVYHALLRPKDDNANTTTVDFDNCVFHDAAEWAVNAEDAGMIRFNGGSFEGNGRRGTEPARYAIRMKNPGRASTKGIVVSQVYFEANHGTADIWIEQGQYDCTHTIRDNDFHRNSTTYYSTNNVLVTRLSGTTGYGELVLSGNGFQPFAPYVPDVSRKYLNIVASNFACVDEGTNTYKDDVEAPNDFGSARSWAKCMFNGSTASPVPYRLVNVASVTKTATGDYEVTLIRPTIGTDTSTICGHVGVNGAGGGYITPISRSVIRVRTHNLSGIPTDFSRVFMDLHS